MPKKKKRRMKVVFVRRIYSTPRLVLTTRRRNGISAESKEDKAIRQIELSIRGRVR